MTTKTELIRLAESKNIRFKKSWSKAKIQEAIDSGVTNDDPLWVTCSRSGLVFDAKDNSRLTVHPTISWWLSRKDYEVRSEAQFAISQGHLKGFTTIKQFEELIEEMLRQKKEEEEASYSKPHLCLTDTGNPYNKKCWVAQITGLSEKYGYEREFVEESRIGPASRERQFVLEKEGYYQSKSYSRGGNSSVYYYHFKDGVLEKIDEDRVKEVFGDPEEFKQAKRKEHDKLNKQVTKVFYDPRWSACTGTVLEVENHFYTVLKITESYEDEDGGCHSYYSHSYDGASLAFIIKSYHCREATEQEIEALQKEQQQRKAFENLRKEFKEIVKDIENSSNKNSPQIDTYPSGKKFCLKQGYYQCNEELVIAPDKIWILTYNWRDGDDWSYNNISGTHFGFWISSAEVNCERLLELAEIISSENRQQSQSHEQVFQQDQPEEYFYGAADEESF